MPDIDHGQVQLAEAAVAFRKRLDLDFVKSMPNGFYRVEDWGCDIDFSKITHGGIGKVLRLVRLTGEDVPVLAAAFSPLTIANKLSDLAHRAHLADNPLAVMLGLK